MSEESLFTDALAISDPVARATFLDRACSGNLEQRRRIDELLAAHFAADSFLTRPAGEDYLTTADFPDGTANYDPEGTRTAQVHKTVGEVGQLIAGKYKLIEAIGEGGMGSVWRAKQTEPVKRFVAVKVIKAGMDSRQVIARFEAERQALALMDHPNIAKVLDGGLHEHRPYFVMELVKGVPITQFCDARKLPPKERLELFVQVCQAIQHAHQKGIIHRDIKPSNVLIALYDDKPVVKVIDFGVAKATGGALTEHTIDTGFGGVVGTPQYMSPEQATFNNVDIDTRSDVYALGVLLYELLAGSPPFSGAELKKKGLLEILRVVREEEPLRPSTKLSTADALPTLSANRATEPKRLTGLLRNELDWIVMKALEKDRTRRYETANGFAADVQRYLSGEAVLAHPPSRSYRVKKFVRRNKGKVVATGLVFFALLAGMAGTTLGLFEAKKQKEIALRESGAREIALKSEEVERKRAEEAEWLAKTRLAQAEQAAKRARQFSAYILNSLGETDFWSRYIPLFIGEEGKTATIVEEIRTSPSYLRKLEAHAVTELATQPHELAKVLLMIGNAMRSNMMFSDAVATLTKARKAFDSSGEATTEDLDRWKFSQACYLDEVGEFAAAYDAFVEILDNPRPFLRFTELADTKVRMAWLCANRMSLRGSTYDQQREIWLKRSNTELNEAMTIYTSSKTPLAKTKLQVCQLLVATRDGGIKLENLSQLYSKIKSFPNGDLLAKGIILFALAETLRQNNSFVEAITKFTELEKLTADTLGKQSLMRVLALGALAGAEKTAFERSPDAILREKSLRDAIAHTTEAITLGKQLAPRHPFLAEGYAALAQLQLANKQKPAAIQAVNEALAIAKFHPVDLKPLAERLERELANLRKP